MSIVTRTKTALQTLDVYQLVAETFDRLLHKGAERSRMNSLTKPSKNRDLGGIGADTPTAVASKPKKKWAYAHFPLPSAPKRTVQTFFSADSSSSEPQAALLRSQIIRPLQTPECDVSRHHGARTPSGAFGACPCRKSFNGRKSVDCERLRGTFGLRPICAL